MRVKQSDGQGSIVGEEIREAISRLPIQIEEENVLYVHASPDDPMQWKYITNARNAYSSLIEMKHSLCFVGHSHIPGIYTYNELQGNGNRKQLYLRMIKQSLMSEV